MNQENLAFFKVRERASVMFSSIKSLAREDMLIYFSNPFLIYLYRRWTRPPDTMVVYEGSNNAISFDLGKMTIILRTLKKILVISFLSVIVGKNCIPENIRNLWRDIFSFELLEKKFSCWG